jgi:predicted secreted protein
MRRYAAVIFLAIGMSLAGCGSAGPGAPAPSNQPTASSPPVPAGGQGSAVTATDRDNGMTIRLRPGQRLRVILSSTYWMIQNSSNTAVLRIEGQPVITPRSGCVPGAGCGTAVATYVAAAAGSAAIIATRTSCGEAMGCTAATGRFSLNVVVS